jgi:hypothetical protein
VDRGQYEKFEVIQGTLISRIDANQAEMRSTVSALVERIGSLLAGMKDSKKAMAYQETTEACLECKEPSPEEIESEVERREVPMEDAIVKPVRGRKKRQRGRQLAAWRREKP